MLWRKPPEIKYTEMCIYIDENVPKIAFSEEFPEIENTIYNYLWLIIKALAIKKHMFQSFEDYDGYAFYAARRLYFALVKSYTNEGKTVKGKTIRPIKSCLNYMKALMYPMKLEYQKQTFNEVISEEFVSKKFDSFAYAQQLKESAYDSQTESSWLIPYLQQALRDTPLLLDRVLVKSPFKKGTVEYKKLKISLLLNCSVMLDTKKKFGQIPQTIELWKLPKSMSNYVKVLLSEFYTELKLEIMDCAQQTKVDDIILGKLIEPQRQGSYDNEG